jgi:hypothetical protein
MVKDLNQVNPSIKIENYDGFMPKNRDGSAFPSACHLQPFATICNQKHSAWVKIDILTVLPPIFRI